MTNYILEYWDKIKSGEIIVSKKIKQVYTKVTDELETPKPPFIFDIEKANKPIAFIETFCYNYEGKFAGKPVKLMLWQKAFIQILYGFVDGETGLRKYNEVLLVIGRKNGKSSLMAYLGLYEMLAEPGAQVCCIANALWQAQKTIFEKAYTMIQLSPDLKKHFTKRKGDLFLNLNKSTFQPLPYNHRTVEGANSSLTFLDEIHEMGDRKIFESLKQSNSARTQPAVIMITTAGFVREGLFDNRYEYATNYLNNVFEDDAFIPFIYELDSIDELENKDMWIKANPSLGEIKNPDILSRNVNSAENDSSFLNSVLTKDFNIIRSESGSWLEWDVLNITDTFDIDMFRGSYGVGGADLSESGDLTCATLICMRKNDPVKYVLQHYFIPALSAQKKENEDKIPYSAFVQQGICTMSGEHKINYSDVTAWFEMIVNDFKIIPYWVGFDDWGSQYWIEEMKSKRFKMIPVRQGFKSISPAMREMESDFKQRFINYNNNNLTKWCLSNTQAVYDPAGNIKFDKSKNKRKRIDGTASLYCAYKVMLDNLKQFETLVK